MLYSLFGCFNHGISSRVAHSCWLFFTMTYVFTDTNEETLLKQALEMSMQADDEGESEAEKTPVPDFSMMNEEQQIAYAMQMSMSKIGTFIM